MITKKFRVCVPDYPNSYALLSKKVKDKECSEMESVLNSLGYVIKMSASEPRMEGESLCVDAVITIKRERVDAPQEV